MSPHENVKDALKEAIDIAESPEVKIKQGDNDWRVCTTKEVQESIVERLYNIADLLGMSEIYLNKED